METPIERRIRTYAFLNDCDLDEASYEVAREIVREAMASRSWEGLYDRLFKEVVNDTKKTDNQG